MFIIIGGRTNPDVSQVKNKLKNVVHLYNRILLSYSKQGYHEIHKQIDGARKEHPEIVIRDRGRGS